MGINTLEIRNYLLQPDTLEHFIDYFEEHFIFTQEDQKMHVLGQFRIPDDQDRFVWLRGFADLQTRLEGLRNFYGGPVWKKYGLRANSMMIDSDNVHLLRPISSDTNLTCGLTAAQIAEEMADGTISPDTGIFAIDFYQALPGKRDELVRVFQQELMPAYRESGIDLRGCFIAEMEANDFPRLPVIQDSNEFVVITAYENRLRYQEQRADISSHLNGQIAALLFKAPETLRLTPTLRSAMRYVAA